jgi:hypothetical protein
MQVYPQWDSKPWSQGLIDRAFLVVGSKLSKFRKASGSLLQCHVFRKLMYKRHLYINIYRLVELTVTCLRLDRSLMFVSNKVREVWHCVLGRVVPDVSNVFFFRVKQCCTVYQLRKFCTKPHNRARLPERQDIWLLLWSCSFRILTGNADYWE